jgi:hypothetical protein
MIINLQFWDLPFFGRNVILDRKKTAARGLPMKAFSENAYAADIQRNTRFYAYK